MKTMGTPASRTSSTRVIDSESIRIIVINLKATVLYSLFRDMWSDLARKFGTPSPIVEDIRQDMLLKEFKQTDAMEKLLNTWVGQFGKKATLQTLINIFRECELTQCAEALKKEFFHNSFTNYSQLPIGLKDFLKRDTKTICIIHTLDNEITCAKILEQHKKTSSTHDLKEILKVIAHPDCDKDNLYIVRDCSIKKMLELKLSKGDPMPKLVFVTNDSEETVKESVRMDPQMDSRIQICEDKMIWDDLSIPHQNIIADRIETMFSVRYERHQLGDILNGEVLVNLINGKSLSERELFQQTLPEALKYYMDRGLITRNNVDLKRIFHHDCHDIFIVEGMELHELGSVIDDQLTDTTTNQVQLLSLTVRFMTMDAEHLSHFDEIVEKTLVPVHLLSYNDEMGELTWKQSKGSVRTIQKYLEETQKDCTEEDFFRKLPSEGNLPICISGNSGTGKSVFLARVGQLLSGSSESDAKKWIDQKMYSNRVVVFIMANDFINKIKEVECDTIRPTKRAILKALEIILCRNDLGRFMLKSKFGHDEVSLEILLDSFDEVDSHYRHFAYRVVKKITSFRFIRLWITSRMLLLNELENSMGVLSYKLNSFCDRHHGEPQTDCRKVVKYLAQYWITTYSPQIIDIELAKLESFAQNCLSSYVSQNGTRKPEEKDADGIVQTFFLIAKLHERTSYEASKSGNPLSFVNDNLSSNLYQLLIESRIQAYVATLDNSRTYNKKSFMDMHVILSIRSLFPRAVIEKCVGAFESFSWEAVSKIGLLDPNSTEENPIFIHRSLAEYFIIWFLIDELKHGCNTTHAWTEGGIWKISRIPRSHVCYIIDLLLLRKQDINPCQLIYFKEFGDKETIQKIATCCAQNDLFNIFTLLLNASAFRKHVGTIFSESLVERTVEHACLEFVKLAFRQYYYVNEQHVANKKLKAKCLSLAVKRGHYGIVQFLINDRTLCDLIRKLDDEFEDLKYLLHTCITNTAGQMHDQIEQRRNIMYRLIRINPKLTNVTDDSQKKPCECDNIDATLEETVRRHDN